MLYALPALEHRNGTTEAIARLIVGRCEQAKRFSEEVDGEENG